MGTQLVLAGSVFAAVSYLFLAIWFWVSNPKNPIVIQKQLVASILFTAISAIAQFFYVFNSIGENPIAYELFDLARSICWQILLIQIFRNIAASKHNDLDLRLVFGLIRSIYLVIFLISPVILNLLISEYLPDHSFTLYAMLRLMLSVLAVILLEQIWRNTQQDQRWHIKFLLLTIGAFFAYDLFFFSYLILFNELKLEIYAARPLVHAITIPLLIISNQRMKKSYASFRLSPEFVFGTTATIVISSYLLGMSLGGYYIRLFGGSWGGVLQILFCTTALLFLAMVLISGQARAKLKVFLSKHLFKYKYNYRSLWLEFTDRFVQANPNTIEKTLVETLADLLESRGGALWVLEKNHYHLKIKIGSLEEEPANYKSNSFKSSKDIDATCSLIKHLEQTTVYDVKSNPELIQDTPLDHAIQWLIIPLKTQDHLIGFVELSQPRVRIHLDWEDIDLIEVVACQAASTLAQFKTAEKLAEAEKFKAMNQVTAFLVHDIKTMVAQLSLMVKNAEKHKSNPEFIDDMLKTTAHSVQKMSHILSQLQMPDHPSPTPLTLESQRVHVKKAAIPKRTSLESLVKTLVAEKKIRRPLIEMTTPIPKLIIINIQDQLHTVLGHLLDNAQDACSEQDQINLRVDLETDTVEFHVTDTGPGMSQTFIENSLFKPFNTTKGLSGMGIGVYQSREMIESLGGNLSVVSKEHQGTCFTLSLPMSYFDSNPFT